MPHVSRRDLGREMDGKRWKNGKTGFGVRDMGLFSRFLVHFPFFFKPVKLAMMSSAWKTEVEDKNNGHTYQSRMAVPAGAASNVEGDEEDLVAVAAAPYCGECGNYGHQRRTSHLCTQNIRREKYQGTYVK
jgi:hypothetical protein